MADLPIGNEGSLTGTTPVTILAAPAASTQRVLPSGGASVHNADTVAHDITFRKLKGATPTIVQKLAAVPAGGLAVLAKKVVLDATDESLQALTDATATTTEPTFDVAAMETTA